MLYDYQIISGVHKGTVVQIEHPISQPALTSTKYEGRSVKVKRLISGGTNFILKGDCWSHTNYSRGIQDKLSKEDRANLDKPNK